MNNIRLTVFDIFSYMIPGLCYVVIYKLFALNLDLHLLSIEINAMNLFSATIYLLLGYLIGLLSDSSASIFLIKITDFIMGDINKRVLKKIVKENPKFNIKEYHFRMIYAFMDLKSPVVREKVDQYSAMSGLARNLSMTFFVSFLFGLYYAYKYYSDVNSMTIWLWMICCIGSSILLLIKADTFRRWSHSHLLYAYWILTNS